MEKWSVPQSTGVNTRRTVLIAEDDQAVRRLLRMALERAGYGVEEAVNGKIAVDYAQGHTVDLLITDLFMPEQEGLETIQAFRRNFPEVKIITVSGAVFAETMLQVSGHLGADVFLAKPLDMKTVVSTVQQLLQ